MNLQNRIELFAALGEYLKKNPSGWQDARKKASVQNPWFTEEFIDLAISNIISRFLQKPLLEEWVSHYRPVETDKQKLVGLVMAGNIPMVGFHDLLTVLISGHRLAAKLSSKDDVLMRFIAETIHDMAPEMKDILLLSEQLKGCDAYIATGSNQSARYFDYYFAKYPHIIRKNKTSVAVLTGSEPEEELQLLSEDIHVYFGLGCRNVTKVFVPEGYDFIPLLRSFNKFQHLRDLQKYANNYDYQLSIFLLNKVMYMSNGSTLMVEQDSIFSAIGVLHYGYYKNREELIAGLTKNPDIQCMVGQGLVPFGEAQKPGLMAYADGVDTFQFLTNLP